MVRYVVYMVYGRVYYITLKCSRGAAVFAIWFDFADKVVYDVYTQEFKFQSRLNISFVWTAGRDAEGV